MKVVVHETKEMAGRARPLPQLTILRVSPAKGGRTGKTGQTPWVEETELRDQVDWGRLKTRQSPWEERAAQTQNSRDLQRVSPGPQQRIMVHVCEGSTWGWGEDPSKRVGGTVAGLTQSWEWGLFPLARLEKFLIHTALGRTLRKVSSQLWRILSPRPGTSMDLPHKA